MDVMSLLTIYSIMQVLAVVGNCLFKILAKLHSIQLCYWFLYYGKHCISLYSGWTVNIPGTVVAVD